MAFDVQKPITVNGVKSRLTGLDPWFEAARQRGYDDSSIDDAIVQAISEFQAESNFCILPTQIICDEDSALIYNGTYGVKINGAEPPTPLPVERHARLPYHTEMPGQWFRLPLPTRPARQVQRIRMFLGTQGVYVFDPSWIQFDPTNGTVQILPFTGTGQAIAGAWGLQIAMGIGAAGTSQVPMALSVDYVAGLPDGWNAQPRYAYLVRGLEECAALKVLQDIAHVYDPGVASAGVSAFGVGQNLNYTRFSDRKQELTEARDRLIQKILKPAGVAHFEVF